jgi:NAD(P)-dependent dehydrogenase (short-subunit alcohol dehydrogenase family)
MFRLDGRNIAVVGGQGLLGQIACETIEHLGGTAFSYDVENGDDITKKFTPEMGVPYHGVINCAIGNQKPVDAPDKYFLDDLEIGLLGARNVALAFERQLRASKGSLVFVGSDLSFLAPDPDRYSPLYKPLSYSVVKHGIVGMTKYYASIWGPDVRVNCLCPGGIDVGQAVPRCPLGRLAKPEDLKGPIAFLLSDASSYMTGATLVVDGGRTIW